MYENKKISEIPVKKISISSLPDSIPARTPEDALLYELFVKSKSFQKTFGEFLDEYKECSSEEAQKADGEKAAKKLREILYEHFKVEIAFALISLAIIAA